MEVAGAEQHVGRLYEDTYKVYIATLVSDKDASVRSLLKHSYKDQILLDSYELSSWLYYDGGT